MIAARSGTTDADAAAKKKKRLERQLAGVQRFAAESERVLGIVQETADELSGELKGVDRFAADLRLATAIAQKLDALVPIPNEIAETLDGPVLFMVALIGLGIYRANEARIAKLEGKLEALDNPAVNTD